MRNFTCINDALNIEKLVQDALNAKANPLKMNDLGKGKTMGLLFFNPSLRTDNGHG